MAKSQLQKLCTLFLQFIYTIVSVSELKSKFSVVHDPRSGPKSGSAHMKKIQKLD